MWLLVAGYEITKLSRSNRVWTNDSRQAVPCRKPEALLSFRMSLFLKQLSNRASGSHLGENPADKELDVG